MPSKKHSCLRTNFVTIITVFSVVFGAALGIILRSTSTETWSKRHIMYLQFPGSLFLRMLKGLIIPLLISSVVSAVGTLDLSMSKKIAMRSIIFYATTTVCAVILGIILVITIRPGVGLSQRYNDTVTSNEPKRNVTTQDTLLDLVRNLFPPNLVQATIYQSKTVLLPPNEDLENATSADLLTWDFEERYDGNTNVLGLVVFAIILGVALSAIGDKGKPMLDFCDSMSEAMMVITGWVIWLTPVGVLFLVAANVMETDSFMSLVGKLGMYFMTVLLGLFIHGFGTLSVIYFVCRRELPFRFLAGLSQVLATAFGTASSSATMPFTIQALDKIGLNPQVTRFVIPVGATINMDGTALYEAVAAIFIAQFREVPISFGQLIAISITATFASIGAAGIPQAGIVTMVMVLDTVGLPANDIALIMAVDWLLDRFRTTINVMCDALGASIVDHLSKDEMRRLSMVDRTNADPHELVEVFKGDTRV